MCLFVLIFGTAILFNPLPSKTRPPIRVAPLPKSAPACGAVGGGFLCDSLFDGAVTFEEVLWGGCGLRRAASEKVAEQHCFRRKSSGAHRESL